MIESEYHEMILNQTKNSGANVENPAHQLNCIVGA
jgi:hypothetical protein